MAEEHAVTEAERPPGARNSSSDPPGFAPFRLSPETPASGSYEGPTSWRRGWRLAALVACVFLVAALVATAAHLGSPLAAGATALIGLSATVVALLLSERRAVAQPLATLRRELDRSRRGHARLFSSVPSFICVLDREHHVVEANTLYRREFDVSDAHYCFEICKRRSKQCVNCLVDRTFEDGETHSSEETLVTRDGRRINVVVHTQPVYDASGEITAVMEVFTDVTEVKKLQRQLALIGRAVAGMAHRVKNILMGLEGGIFIVNDALERDDREAVSQGWEMVERNVHLVTGVVKDLLFCAKDREPNFQPDVCLQDIVTDVFTLYEERVQHDTIELQLEVSAVPPRGTFDPDGIHNLLCNLVANAIDACRFDPAADKDHHLVTLRCLQNGAGAAILEVEDNGPGIPEDLSNKVFQDFFSSKGTEGTGIGLLVVQKVAEEHGGQVSFDSTPGQGTTFTVVIPHVNREAAARDARSRSTARV
jgi:PAS domain S-box-containing protein